MDLTLVNVEDIVLENTKMKADMRNMIIKLRKVELENAELKRVARASIDATALMFRESVYQKQRAENLQQLSQDLLVVSSE